jgi:alpha-L-fucosidase
MGVPDWWTKRRFGLLVHANVASVPAWAPIGQYADWYRAHSDGGVPDVLLHPSPLVETLAHHRDRWAHIETYDDFVPFLTFEEWDADAWTALARDAGMDYAVMVAKHHDGWCWWDAPNTERTVLREGPRRNVLAEFAAACERADLPFGTYYSLLDWGDVRYGSPAYVDEVVHPHVLDLVERYGSKMVWGDGHWGGGESHWRSDELIVACRRLDPDVVVNDRWWWDGDRVCSFEYRMPEGIVDQPWEHRRGLGGSFNFNQAEHDDHLMSGFDIVALLTEVVAKGGHLLLSVGPDSAGRIPADHAERLVSAGGWVRRHRDLIERATPWRSWGDLTCRYLVVDGQLHVVDVGGRGRFAALVPRDGTVASIETIDGQAVGFDQDDRGVSLDRPSRSRQRMPSVYRVRMATTVPRPVALFGDDRSSPPRELAEAIGDARPGDIVQLGEGVYVGPARIPDRVTVRGLGPDRTVIDGLESVGVALGRRSRLEHCRITGGGPRIAWLPQVAVSIADDQATMIGCRVAGHIEVTGHDAKISSCAASGVVARGADRLTISRSQFTGMHWDCGVDIEGGAGALVESCEFAQLLVAIRCTRTVAVTIRNNTVAGRWWGVQLVDAESTLVSGNSFERTMRAVDVDGGIHAEITGNASIGGDSGCVVQRGAADCSVAGNHWERCRIGLLAWEAGDVRHHDNQAVDLGEPDGAYVAGP